MKRIQMRLFIVLTAVAWAFPLFAKASPPQDAAKPCGTVTVAAAGDLIYAMNEITANFHKASGCAVRVTAGSTGNILTQIENGAPFDLFFSADMDSPRKLEADGFAAPGSTYMYGIGKIVLWVRSDSTVDVSKGFEALRDPSIKKIAVANPQHAPYGRAAQEAMRNAGVYDAVKDRLVMGENIAQASQFVQTGNAGAGVIALSIAILPGVRQSGRYWTIPETLYTPIQQGAVVVRGSKNEQGAQLFLAYIKKPATTSVLARYGFIQPAKGKP